MYAKNIVVHVAIILQLSVFNTLILRTSFKKKPLINAIFEELPS